MNDITKHEWNDDEIDRVEVNGNSLVIYVECGFNQVELTKNDVIAMAKLFIDRMTNEELQSCFDTLTNGGCGYCWNGMNDIESKDNE